MILEIIRKICLPRNVDIVLNLCVSDYEYVSNVSVILIANDFIFFYVFIPFQ